VRSLTVLVALLLALMFAPIKSQPTEMATAQVRFVTTEARPKNAAKLQEHFRLFNQEVLSLNGHTDSYKSCWDIDPADLLPHLDNLDDQIHAARELLLNLDKEPK
jgi:hypothetical protein